MQMCKDSSLLSGLPLLSVKIWGWPAAREAAAQGCNLALEEEMMLQCNTNIAAAMAQLLAAKAN